MRKQDWLVQMSGLRWLQRIDAIKAEPPFLFLTQEDKMRNEAPEAGCHNVVPHGGGRGGTWVNFCWVCAAGLSEPLTSYKSILWPIIHPTLVTFGQICNFRDCNSVTFSCFELTHSLDWMKNTLLFICSTNMLVRLPTVNLKNCLTQKNSKMCYPIIVQWWKCDPIQRHIPISLS